MMMPNLTPLEARVVDTVFGRRDFSDATALKEVAEDAGISEAMVVKIAKKLAFPVIATSGRTSRIIIAYPMSKCMRSFHRRTPGPRSSRRYSGHQCRRWKRRLPSLTSVL